MKYAIAQLAASVVVAVLVTSLGAHIACDPQSEDDLREPVKRDGRAAIPLDLLTGERRAVVTSQTQKPWEPKP